MKKLFLLSAFLFLQINSASAYEQSDIFKVSVFFNRGQVNIADVEVGKGFIPSEQLIDDSAPVFWLEAIADNGRQLIKKEFNIHLFIMGEPPLPGETESAGSAKMLLEETSELVIMPYYPDIKWLNLYDANWKLIEKKDVSGFARVCGNGICQNEEDYGNCPADCNLLKDNQSICNKNGKCDSGESVENCQEDCLAVSDGKREAGIYMYIIAGTAALLLFFMIPVIMYFLRKRKKESRD